MRILFIKLRHIGDSLLLTPTIVATKAKFPDAKIWVLVRNSCDAILAGCPEIDRILTTANPDATKRNHSDWIADIKLAAFPLPRTTKPGVAIEPGMTPKTPAPAGVAPLRCTTHSLP